jgi:hypothetical protein
MEKELLNGNDDLAKVKKMVNKYQNDFAAKVKKGGETKDYILPHAYAYKKADLERVLMQDNCEGIRVYFAEEKDKETITLVIVGTDKDGNNILPMENIILSEQEGVMIDTGQPCPSNCPSNPL